MTKYKLSTCGVHSVKMCVIVTIIVSGNMHRYECIAPNTHTSSDVRFKQFSFSF